jgi:hypothetical protein
LIVKGKRMSNALITIIAPLERPVFDAITAWGMALLACGMAAAWTGLIAKRSRRDGVVAALALAVLLLAHLAGDALGWFSRLDLLPPPFVVMNGVVILVVLALGMGYVGRVGSSAARSVQVETLVALQIFRLPLELLMLRAAYLQIMPLEFSMLGYNLDVLTGIGALFISIYCAWTWSLPVRAIWAWNLLGIACLVVIAVLAVLTSPNVHAFGTGPLHINSWVLYFPYSLLPSVLVSCAVLGHVLLTRKLLAEHPISLATLASLPALRWLPWPKPSRDAW